MPDVSSRPPESDPVAEAKAFLSLMDQNRQFVHRYREYRDKIMHYFLFRLRGDRQTAEDLSSALFLRTYERFSQYDDRYAFSTWVYTIARNMLIDHLRKQGRVALAPLEDAEEIASDERDFFEAADVSIKTASLQKAVKSRPPLQADAVYRRHILFQSFEEIASALGTTPESARQLVSRGSRTLRSKLSADAIFA
jgi:RNA polymerase sigma-70 factor, ECF subfamily